jgi:hypothetical protein
VRNTDLGSLHIGFLRAFQVLQDTLDILLLCFGVFPDLFLELFNDVWVCSVRHCELVKLQGVWRSVEGMVQVMNILWRFEHDEVCRSDSNDVINLHCHRGPSEAIGNLREHRALSSWAQSTETVSAVRAEVR